MKILMVLTSHDRLGDTGRKTGFWLEEFAAPFYALKDAGHDITLASPKGGQPPLDPKSDEPDAQTDATRRFRADSDAQARLASTERLESVRSADFDAVFYPGGHGPLWDLVDDPNSRALIEETLAAGKPVALVCHAPAVLKNVRAPDGQPLARGKRLTGFTNAEEEAVGLTKHFPVRRGVISQPSAERSAAFSKSSALSHSTLAVSCGGTTANSGWRAAKARTCSLFSAGSTEHVT